VKEQSEIPHHEVTAALVWNLPPFSNKARILITKRRPDDESGGLWEFPGGKQEAGESLHACLARELAEELAIAPIVGERFITVEQEYPSCRITLHVFHCQHTGETPQCIACADWQWVTIGELARYQFSAADMKVIAAIRQTFRILC
jgi:mutator protein MutT